MSKKKAFCCWSGGKESALSCYKVMRNQSIKVTYLLNMISEDGKYSRSHGINPSLLQLQAEAIGISIIQRRTTWETYEEEFKKAVLDFKRENIRAGIFGDIDLQEHREWVESVCKKMEIKPILPLWERNREDLLKEFIQAGFKAIVVAVKADFLTKEWLGRELNNEFIEDLKALGSIDLCGENGEYHTFVYDGSIFKKPVEFKVGNKYLKDRHWFLEII